MTAMPTEKPAPAPRSVPGGRDQHTSRCYWDLFECRWQCAPHDPVVERTKDS